MLDGMSDSIQGSRIENLHSREVDRQSPTGLIFLELRLRLDWLVLVLVRLELGWGWKLAPIMYICPSRMEYNTEPLDWFAAPCKLARLATVGAA